MPSPDPAGRSNSRWQLVFLIWVLIVHSFFYQGLWEKYGQVILNWLKLN